MERETPMTVELPNVPEPKRTLLENLVRTLSEIPGMAAVVLGGSYAAGKAHDGSDLDVGLYYREANPFSVAEVRRIADGTSAKGPATVTGFYEWGAWVNGGAWIFTALGKVDFLYRNLDQVERTIADAQRGVVQHDYDQQPAYGFYSVMYLAETQICLPLYDPDGLIADLKRKVENFPPRLKERTVAESLWSAEFTLMHARSFAAQGDIYNTAGCLTRAAASLTQALFALNGRYYLRDKQAMEALATFPNLPKGLPQVITDCLGHPGKTAQELTRSVEEMADAWRSVTVLQGVEYRSKY
jgi:hypothetical protein